MRACREIVGLCLGAVLLTGCDGFYDWLGLGGTPQVRHGNLPQVGTYGGPVLTAPNVVPIFYEGDPLEPQIEKFLSALPGSSYWRATTSEYGVGDIRIAPSIVVPEAPPAAIGAPGIKKWLAEHLDGTHPGWPPLDMNNIYTVVYPASTTVFLGGGTGCVDFGGFHSEGFLSDAALVSLGDGGVSTADAGAQTGPSFVYAVVPACPESTGLNAIDSITSSMSHEIVEAATNPLAVTQPAFGQVAGPDLAWAISIPPSEPISLAGEAADLCSYEEGQRNLYGRLVGDFMVQRSWSNAAAWANQDPCVPAVAGVYFNAAPDLYEPVTLRLSDDESYVTNGVRVPLHESRTVDIRLFSAGKRPDWYVTASDLVAAAGGPTSLAFQWDRRTGNDGAFLRLTITRTAEGPIGGSPIYIYSTNAPDDFDTGTVWAGFVGN